MLATALWRVGSCFQSELVVFDLFVPYPTFAAAHESLAWSHAGAESDRSFAVSGPPAGHFYNHTLPEFLRLRSYNHLLFNPTLILLPPGGLGVAGGSENTLELKEVVLAFNALVLRGLWDPCETDRRGL